MTLPSISTLIAMTAIYGLLLALSRRPLTSLALVLYLLGFVLLSSFVKQAYLGLVTTVADVRFFLLRPKENFHLFVSYPLLGVSLFGVVVGAVFCLWISMRLERPLRLFTRARGAGWWRVATASLSVLIGAGASLLASPASQVRADNGDAWVAFQSMYEQLHPTGLINRINIFFNNRSFDATLPNERSQTRFSETPSATGDAKLRPDIMLVLEESTFDPTMIRACSLPECEQAMMHPLAVATRTQQGPLLVHTTGGGTWLAEFAIMSGFDWRVFGRGGAYAPVSLAPRLKISLPRQLRALGYRTVAIYPTEGFFLSARSAYEHYGFEEFYDAQELGLPDQWEVAFDRLVFAKSLQKVQPKADPRPVFVFVLTIRNHGPHGQGKVPVPSAYQKIQPQIGAPIADYLARMHDSSQDYLEAASVWLHSPRPRVIAWFGDHQPEAAWDFTEHSERLNSERTARNVSGEQLKYLTQYQFSANFGEREQAVSRDALDISYLGMELLAFARLPLDSGESAARQVAVTCNGLLLDCTDHALIDDYLSFRIHELGAVK